METINESTIRSRARRHGYVVKSRRKMPSQWDRCGYILIHADTNIIVAGPYVDASLPEVENFLARFEGGDG